jgi:uncharacterized protein (TIGR03000 family)
MTEDSSMFRKILMPAVLSLACFLMVTDFASAQPRGGGYRGGSYSRGYYNNGYYNNGYRNNVGVGVYVGPGYGWWGGRGYDRPYNRSYYYDTYPTTSFYYEPAPTIVQQAPAADVAHIRVILPDANARVWFDGNATRQTGADRMFHTPTLTAGSNNVYRIRASWMQGGREMTQERSASVTPGATAVVDFTQATSEPLPRD